MANELKSTKINGDLSVTGNINVSTGTINGNLEGTASSADTVRINSTSNNTNYKIMVSPDSSIGTPLSHKNVAVNINADGATTLDVTGTVNATYLTGDGSGIKNINAANIVGNLDSGLFSVSDKTEIATAVSKAVTIGTVSQPLTIKASTIEINGPTTINSDLKVSGNVNITGEANIGNGIKINGSTTIVDATTLSTGDTLIELGSGDRLASSTPALASTQYAGFYVQKYDGKNSGALVFDNTGTAYVGDVQVSGNTISPVDSSTNESAKSLQPLATRVKTIAHNSIIKWDNNDKTLKPIEDGDIKSVATGDASNGNIAIVNSSGNYSSIYRTGIKIQDSVNIVTSGSVSAENVIATNINSKGIVNGKVQIAENTIVVKASASGETANDVIRLDSAGSITAYTASIPNIIGNLNGKATEAGIADAGKKLVNIDSSGNSIDINTGSITQPIYFKDGKPEAITGAIANDTTGNAATATKLETSHNFSITGGATASAIAFNGEHDVALNVTSIQPNIIVAGTIGTDKTVVDIRGTADKANQVNVTASVTGNVNIPYISGSDGAQTVYAGGIPASFNSLNTKLVQFGNSDKKVNINGQADTVNEKISLGENLSGEVGLTTKDSNNSVTLNATVKEIGSTSSTANVNVNQSLNLLKSKSLILQGADIPWYITNSSNALTFGSIDSNNNLTIPYAFGVESATFNQEINANSNITISDSGKISSKSVDLRSGFNLRLFDSVGTGGSSTNLDYVGLELIQGSKTGTDYNVGLRLNRKSYYTTDDATGYYQNNIPGNSKETSDARIIPLIFSSANADTLISHSNSSASGTILKYDKGAIVAANPGIDYFSSEGSFAASELSSKILPIGSINLSDYQTSIKTNTNVTVSITQSDKLIGVLPFFTISNVTTDAKNNLYNFTIKPYVPEGIITKTTADGKEGYIFNNNSDRFPVLTKAADSGVVKIDGTITNADALNTSAGSATRPVYFSDGKPVKVGDTLGDNKNKINITGAAEESKKLVETVINDDKNELIGIDRGSATLPVYFVNGLPVATNTTLDVSINGNASTATTATAAEIAERLGTNAGSESVPVYFSDGKPVKVGDTLGTSEHIISINGNAATATKLQTARTILINGKEGSKTNASMSFDGSADASITLTSGIITEALGFIPLKDSDAMTYRGSVTEDKVKDIMGGTRVNGDVYLYNGDKITVSSSITGTTEDLIIEKGDMLVVYVSGNTKQWTVIERNNTDAVSFNGDTSKIGESTLAYFKTSQSKDISNSSIKISDTTITADLLGNASTATRATTAETADIALKLNTNAGSTTQPVYFKDGEPVPITGAISNNTTGNAATATKLTTSSGNTTLPVYFSGGKPVATSTTLNVCINGTAETSKKLIAVDGSQNLVDVNAGSNTQPIYFADGVPKAITGSIENDTTGNAATATKLQTDINISISGGATADAVSFNGTKDVTLNVTALDPAVITAGSIVANVNLLGNAATATTAYALASNNIGSSTLPVYFNADGHPVATSTTLDVCINGNAASADKLNTNAGSTTQPVYFKDGEPVPITGAISNNTTGNANTASNLSKKGTGFLYQSSTNVTEIEQFAANSVLGTTGDSAPSIALIRYSSNASVNGNVIVEAVNGAFTAGTITANTFKGSLSGTADVALKLNTNAGSASQPIYFADGIPKAIIGTISNNAASASKLNISASIGSNSKPVYFSGNGVPVAISATIGSSSTPVYINGGTITAITGAISNNTTGNSATSKKLVTIDTSGNSTDIAAGSTIKPVFFSGGVPVQCVGPIQSPGFAIESNDNGTLNKRATISYNTTDQCIEFIFV